MGRHLVFYNCSQSMASSVVKRMLTGMILSGTWVCFEDAHKLSQLMLSILGDYLGSVRQAYQCLMMNRNNQYLVRGQSKEKHGKNATKVSFTVVLSRYAWVITKIVLKRTVCQEQRNLGKSYTHVQISVNQVIKR